MPKAEKFRCGVGEAARDGYGLEKVVWVEEELVVEFMNILANIIYLREYGVRHLNLDLSFEKWHK